MEFGLRNLAGNDSRWSIMSVCVAYCRDRCDRRPEPFKLKSSRRLSQAALDGGTARFIFSLATEACFVRLTPGWPARFSALSAHAVLRIPMG